MELFFRRYFCFICFAFVLTAFALTFYSGFVKIAVAIIAAIGVACSTVLLARAKKRKFEALFALLICFAISVSAFNSCFFVTRAKNKAVSFVGENTVLVKIISQSGEGEYDVRLLRVGDTESNIKSLLYFETEKELEYGDRLAFNADIEASMDSRDRSRLLAVAVREGSEIYVDEAERKNYFSLDGISALCHSLQNKFSAHVDKTFGEYGALAKGLLVNDTSDIDKKTETDFKRSGTSHILAVSGMHIALLMGALELLLRKIRVKKEIRIVIISLFSVFFLALTAFEASAVRSVLMLFAVYLNYMLREDNDSITALFASVAIIILFSPFAVYDLGMWMSFLATLGILAVYPYFEEKMPYPKQENRFVRYSLRLLVWIAKTVMLTVIANFFLLPIMWYFFGAASISTLPCNLILAPVVTVLMPLCAIATLLGFIPYLSVPFVFVSSRLFDVMMGIVRYFSEMRFGVVSLRYEFVGVLVTLLALALAVLLVIRLKRKLLIFVPMLAFLLAFTLCFSILTATAKPYAVCVQRQDSELVFVNYGAECSVIDVGKGNSVRGNTVVNNMSKYATEIDEYFIVDPDKNDVNVIESVSKNTVIRKIYLPKTLELTQISSYYDILKCAEKYNITVELLEDDSSVEICNSVLFNYSELDGFSVSSSTFKIKSADDALAIEYNGEVGKIKFNNKISEVIPLN